MPETGRPEARTTTMVCKAHGYYKIAHGRTHSWEICWEIFTSKPSIAIGRLEQQWWAMPGDSESDASGDADGAGGERGRKASMPPASKSNLLNCSVHF